MSIESRPYIGTWSLNDKELVQHTPDALVYLNGDTALPGCPNCKGKIDIQQFLTECSVDAGTEAGSASASFTLSVPVHHTQAFARDARFLLKPGLEVHIYMRGYFAVQGLYENLAEPGSASSLIGGSQTTERVGTATEVTASGVSSQADGGGNYVVSGEAAAQAAADIRRAYPKAAPMASAIVDTANAVGASPYMLANVINFETNGSFSPSKKNPNSTATGLIQFIEETAESLDTSTAELAEMSQLEQMVYVERYLDQFEEPLNTEQKLYMSIFYPKYMTVDPQTTLPSNVQAVNVGIVKVQDYIDFANRNAKLDASQDPTLVREVVVEDTVTEGFETLEDTGTEEDAPEVATQAEFGPSLLEELGLQNSGVEKALAYPYYHVFHGVVTEVGHSYSGGVNTITVSCSSMLHFWQYQNMSTNASVFGARPTNSKLKMSMVGHNFTGMHPYEILYTLHYDTAGAAGGVGYALASKTNQTSVSEVGDESLYSLAIRYWEKRFQGRNIRLRMHGATGELFSTMAAAWLSRTSSSNLTRLLRERYSERKSDSTMKVMSQAASVGLYNANRRDAIEATRFAANSGGGNEANSPKFEVNVLEMQAFVSNIGNWGQVNLFESSYESKLDIAQRVCEVTGFEFYQDVDGDYVFKPPMYNLDTSGSRVYRIEDIDIINISFSEKEPQATYMTVKGSQFKNLAGTGVENEWGVRGQFIDYRLVAQFGWRPGSYETAYFNDPKSMFFAAVNRMDILNIGINSASVTIPVRPELRPGYPVYIPYLDCYYYCNSFSHSHSVGGQCTTTLQLVGKRAKFYAPGAPGVNGISDIDLGNTLLPQRPLQVLNEEGKPRLSGFPNVVMALDPTAINPLFFVVGMDVENLSDPQVIKNLLDIGVQMSVLEAKKDPTTGTTAYVMHTAEAGEVPANGLGSTVQFFLNEADINDFGVPDTLSSDPTTTTINVLAAAIEYDSLQKSLATQTKSTQEQLLSKQGEINSAQTELSQARQRGDKDSTIDALNAKIDRLTRERAQIAAALQDQVDSAEAAWNDPTGKNAGVAFLLEMVDRIGQKYRLKENVKGRSDLSNPTNLLDMLSDKKAVFSNGTQPGYYRYYSASHPNPEHQGPKRAEYLTSESSKVVQAEPETIEGGGPTVWMYSERPTAPFPGAKTPEAELVQGQPTVGIRVLNSDPTKPDGEVVSTSEVMELMFTTQPVTAVTTKTSTFRRTTVGSLGKSVQKSYQGFFDTIAVGVDPAPTDTLEGYYQGAFETVAAGYAQAVGSVVVKAVQDLGVSLPSLPLLGFPSDVQVWAGSMNTADLLSEYQYSGNEEGSVSLGARGAKATLNEVVNKAGSAIANSIFRQMNANRATLDKTLKAEGVEADDRDALLGAFNGVLSAQTGAEVAAATKGTSSKDVFKQEKTFSPVFPVSDANGYEVIGNYRYGRGVDIEPGGVFDQLHRYDVFSLLDKNLVDQILRVFVRGQQSITGTLYETETLSDGTQVTRPVAENQTLSGEAAVRSLNEEVLRQLRDRNVTDKQILDWGLATMGEQPGQLDFQLANYFADDSRDGTQKIPVINAAYSLADLNVEQDGGICDCKASEADVLLTAFGQQEFVSFTQASAEGLTEDPGDAATRWMSNAMTTASLAWETQQQALRGQVLDRGGSSIVSDVATTLGIGADNPGPLEQARQASAEARNAVSRGRSQVKTARENLGRPPEEDR